MNKEMNTTKVDFSFGFTSEELNLMHMHFNGMKFSRRIEFDKDKRKHFEYLGVSELFNKESFLNTLRESYELNGYSFEWDTFADKIMSLDQYSFAKLIKYLLVEWVDVTKLLYCFYTFGVDVDDFIEKENEELNNI